MGFPGGSVVKNPLVMQETWVRSLGGEDPLEKNMATHSSVVAWRILWTEEPGGLQALRSQRVRHDWSNGTRTQACMSVTSIKLEKRIKQKSTGKISNWLNSHSYLACHFCINTHSINGKDLSFLDTLNFIRMSISGFWSLPPFAQLH